MQRLFPENIRKIGLFPLSYGNQGELCFQTALQRLDEMGATYKIALPEGGEYRYLAGRDEARADAFNRLLTDKSIDLLFAIRGGFGAARTLPYINWDLLLQRNIPVVGYSDMTAFLLPAWKKGFRNAILGKMAESTFGNANLTPDEVERCAKSLYDAVAGKVISPAGDLRLAAVKAGCVTAPVVPCNLTVLISLIGTPWMPDLSGTILVVESIGQGTYQIERELNQLEQCGILASLKGLVFGSMTGADFTEYLPDIYRDYAAKVPGPAASGLEFGHEDPSAVIRVGGIATLSVTESDEVNFA